MQERRNSIAYTLELRVSCTNPSTYSPDIQKGSSTLTKVCKVTLFLKRHTYVIKSIPKCFPVSVCFYDAPFQITWQCNHAISNMAHLHRDILTLVWSEMHYFKGLVQERCNSSALAMELSLSCINSLVPGKFEWNLIHVIFKWILMTDSWGISCEIALI